MKTWEKVAIGAGIIAIAYFVMKDKDDDKDKYVYQRKKTSEPSSAYKDWSKTGSRS